MRGASTPKLVEVRGVARVPAPYAIPDAASCTALTNVGGHRAVVIRANGVEYADKDTMYANLVFGITQGAMSQGDQGMVQTGGLLTEPSWNWIPEQPIFLGNNGMLTQEVPETGFSLLMGTATAPQTIYIHIGQAVEL